MFSVQLLFILHPSKLFYFTKSTWSFLNTETSHKATHFCKAGFSSVIKGSAVFHRGTSSLHQSIGGTDVICSVWCRDVLSRLPKSKQFSTFSKHSARCHSFLSRTFRHIVMHIWISSLKRFEMSMHYIIWRDNTKFQIDKHVVHRFTLSFFSS